MGSVPSAPACCGDACDRQMTSIIIAAHNEAAVIGRCLDSLLRGSEPGEFQIIVVANGCKDDTAVIAARRAGVTVLRLAEGNKSLALNEGDSVATRFPRIYLDADICVTSSQVRAISGMLLEPIDNENETLAAVPARSLDLAGRPVLVRGYYAISSRLPAFQTGLFGRGMIGLSEAGRSRFKRFPDMVADDLFLDSLFSPDEKRHVDSVATTIATPRRTADLVRRLVRVRRGNLSMRQASRSGDISPNVRSSDRWSWLNDVVVPQPSLLPAACAFFAITMYAEIAARMIGKRSVGWAQDRTTRQRSSTDSVSESR